MKGPLTTGKHPEVESSIRLRELLKNRHSGTGHVPDIDVLDAAGLDYRKLIFHISLRQITEPKRTEDSIGGMLFLK